MRNTATASARSFATIAVAEREFGSAAIHVGSNTENSRLIDLMQGDGETQNGKQPFVDCAGAFTLAGRIGLAHAPLASNREYYAAVLQPMESQA